MKAIAVALVAATLAGCIVVPVGRPGYVDARVDYYGRPYGPYWRR